MTDEKPMQGKIAVVTGATSGIGLASVAALVRDGACVIGVGRTKESCAAAKSALEKDTEGEIDYLAADLSLQSQVRQLAEDIRSLLHQKGKECLDVLVNNAGIYSSKLVWTEEGIELTLAVNHIAPFLLTHELLPQLKDAPDARIITVSSASHYGAWLNLKRLNNPLIYFGFHAYRVSKFANVLFTCELKRRLGDTSVRAFAVDPGLVNTEIGMKRSGGLFYLFWENRRKKGNPPEVPALTVAYLSREKNLQQTDHCYWRDCQPKAPSRLSRREDLAEQLWETTMQLCGLTV